MIRRQIRLLALACATGAALLLGACASAPTPADYTNEQPVLDLPTYFNGTLTAHGIFTDRAGKVARRFTVLMKCNWVGDDGTLDEDFTYSDVKKERRIWKLKKLPGGKYTGTAGDVVGTAQGESAGNALRWAYTLRLPVGDSVYEVQFDDWMYLMDDRTMINKAVMSKFGIRLGEVTLAFQKN